MERKIRNSAKALIINDGKMLVSKIDDNGEIYYVMPGGGQEVEELLPDAVKRECAEEMGILVEPKSLVFVVEGVHGEDFQTYRDRRLEEYCLLRSEPPLPTYRAG